MYTVTVETQRDDYKRKGGDTWSFVTECSFDARHVAAREVLERLERVHDFDGLDNYADYFLSRDPEDVWEWYEEHGESFFEGEYVPWTFRVTIKHQNTRYETVDPKQMEKFFDSLQEIYGDQEEDEE